MKNIVIRKVRKEDVVDLADAFKKIFLPHFKLQNLSESSIKEQFLLNDEKHLLARFKGNYFFVAEDVKNKKVVGLIGFRKNYRSKVHNRVSSFFILQEYRGKGIGSLLFNKILELVIEFKVKKLVVNSSTTAEEIYRHWGFKKVRMNNKRYPNGDVFKNVWMEKSI